jgi:hypothetical protein
MRRRRYVGFIISTTLAGCSELTSRDEDSSEDTYTTENGIRLIVSRVETTEEFVLDGETPFVPQGDSRAVLVQLSAENTTDKTVQLPTPSQFTVEAGTDTRDPYQVTFKNDPGGLASTISDPVSGPLFPPTTALSGDSNATGWLIFGVPVESSDATLQLHASDGSVSNEWALSFETTS